jgi:hypothetical protein
MAIRWQSYVLATLAPVAAWSIALFISTHAFAQIVPYYVNDSEFHGIDVGSRLELCRAYERGIREWKAPYRACGIAIPSGDRNFRAPKWEILDPAQHMDLVRDIYYWANLNHAEVGRDNYYDRQARSVDILPDLLEQIWNPARSEIEQLISEGRVKLQRSRLDIDFDGKSEFVYRMSPILRPWRFKRPEPGIVHMPVTIGQAVPCEPGALPEDQGDFVFFVRAEDSLDAHSFLRRHHLWPGMNLVSWKQRIYWLIQQSIYEPKTSRGDKGNLSNFTEVCRFRYLKKID